MSNFNSKKVDYGSFDQSNVIDTSISVGVYSNSISYDDSAEYVDLDVNVVPDDFIGPLLPGQRYEHD